MNTKAGDDDELYLYDMTITGGTEPYYHPKLVVLDTVTVETSTGVELKSGKRVKLLPGTSLKATADKVSVLIGGPPDGYPNLAPMVDAGPDLELQYPANGVEITVSFDDDGLGLVYPASYTFDWVLPAGVSATCTNCATPQLTFSKPGTFTLTARVSDGEFWGEDDVVVTVTSPENIFPEEGYAGVATTEPDFHFDVRGTVRADEIHVKTLGADYVFEPDYKLMPLAELEAYVKKEKHLPGIPTAAQMQKNGVSMSELVTLQLGKIEELTLYMIKLEEERKALEKSLKARRERIDALKGGAE